MSDLSRVGAKARITTGATLFGPSFASCFLYRRPSLFRFYQQRPSQPTTVVTSEIPFIPPIQPATGSSVVQSTGPVIQVSSSQTQPTTGTSDPAFSLQLTGSAVQKTPSQTLTGKSVRPISSLAGAALSQDPDPDLE